MTAWLVPQPTLAERIVRAGTSLTAGPLGGPSVRPPWSVQAKKPSKPSCDVPPTGQQGWTSPFSRPTLIGAPGLVPASKLGLPFSASCNPRLRLGDLRLEPIPPHSKQWVLVHPGRHDTTNCMMAAPEPEPLRSGMAWSSLCTYKRGVTWADPGRPLAVIQPVVIAGGCCGGYPL